MDDRFGFATHFDFGPNSGYTNSIMPNIAATGAAWIRDDVGWSGIEHAAKGSYGNYSGKVAWIQAAHDAGLKLVGDIQAGGAYSPPSSWYANPYDPEGYGNACAWMATQVNTDGSPQLGAIEILNEPNNSFRSYENSIGRGNLWREDYVTLLNTAYDKIKAVNPNMPVIGCGVQGSDIIYMLNLGAKLDGIVAHPYDPNDSIPEHCYEPSYTYFETFVSALRTARPNTPLWFTEQAVSTGNRTYEYNAAVWVARRLLISYGVKVEHTFLYDFLDSSTQGILGFYYDPHQAYFVVNRIIPVLAGLTSKGSVVTVTNPAVNFDSANFKNFVFGSTTTGTPTVAALWFGNKNSLAGNGVVPAVATVNFPLQHAHWYGQSSILDTISGNTVKILEPDQAGTGPKWTSTYGAISNVTVSDRPILIVVK